MNELFIFTKNISIIVEKFKHRREQLSERRHGSFYLILKHRMAGDQKWVGKANFPASHIESSKFRDFRATETNAGCAMSVSFKKFY